jgi:hypothetical protein
MGGVEGEISAPGYALGKSNGVPFTELLGNIIHRRQGTGSKCEQGDHDRENFKVQVPR